MQQFIISVFAIALSGNLLAQKYSTTFEESIDTQGISTVIISNVYGAIDAAAGSDKIEVIADVNMSGRNQAQLDRLESGISLGIERWADTLLVYNKAPWLCERYLTKDCHYQWNSRTDGDYRFDIKVSLPANLNLEAATVNHGDITIEGMTGLVSADNVNGSIKLKEILNVADARTINGQLEVKFKAAPSVAGNFYALNGDITSEFPEDLSAEIFFKSFNGDFFTDFDFSTNKNAAQVKVNESRSGTTYKIEEKTSISVGGGDVPLSFETLNGNMYVKRN
ncbi:MAG: hypothetical protein AAGC88_04490 [Bacteroidota bacterium]